ncbi:Bbp16 family capsid cement protein [Reyranella sp.]|uniref:Bbp16 family capsid cement protein n=1 Tax=Reyranella sp. TaxID=1929291 RepID=UPI003BAC4FBF
MMYDKLNTFGTDQAVTTTAASTDIVDLGAARDMGNGEALELVILVTETVTAAGAATVTFTLETDDNAGFASAFVLASSGAIAKAALTAGTEVLRVKVPLDAERFLRTNYTVATGPLTAGKFTAFLAHDRQASRAYASGFTV